MLELHSIARKPDCLLTGDFIACGPGGCRIGRETLPDWTPTPEGKLLREERLARREGLQACAVRLGLRASALSALEQGRETLPDDEWKALLDAARDVQDRRSR